MNNVEAFYDANAAHEWERFDRHRMEFAITKRALAEYLPPLTTATLPAHVLDCGGGPGRYSIHLARQGCAVTLLDLSAGNLALAKEKAREEGARIEDFVHGNALDLTRFADASFDAVLLLGPLYHLLRAQDRQLAVREARRVLKPGGRIFAGFITLYAPFRDAIAKGYLRDYSDQPAGALRLLETQVDAENEGFTSAWFARPEDVLPLMEGAGLKTLALLAAEGIAAGHEQHINALEEAAFAFWLELNYRFCRDPHLLGAADHLLYIGER